MCAFTECWDCQGALLYRLARAHKQWLSKEAASRQHTCVRMTKAMAEQVVKAAVSAFVKQVGGLAHMASFDSNKGSSNSSDEASEAADNQGWETDSNANDSNEADDVVNKADFRRDGLRRDKHAKPLRSIIPKYKT